MKRKGFTLIELLVVIAIIAILFSILLPILSRTKRNSMGIVTSSNMRQIAIAATMYADDNNDRYPTTMRIVEGVPSTINFWDIDSYQSGLNKYIISDSGIGRNLDRSRNVWFDPADSDKNQPTMWGSFIDNGFVTGIGIKTSGFKNFANTIYSGLRHSMWSESVGVKIPNPVPYSDKNNSFWYSEYFDMCVDPWKETLDRDDEFHWSKGKAMSPFDLFNNSSIGSNWSLLIEGRNKKILKGDGRYGKKNYYSFCDGSVRKITFESTYLNTNENNWNVY